jgi:hypothetical protein
MLVYFVVVIYLQVCVQVCCTLYLVMHAFRTCVSSFYFLHVNHHDVPV